jgi:ATP-dependent DNA ligase
MPDWLEPMAATLTEERFAGPEWLFERKFDGIRLLTYKRGSEVDLYSRNHLPQQLPALAAAVARLPVDEVILDGEVTWDGTSGYHVFDILWLDGRLVANLPLEERRTNQGAAVRTAATARRPLEPVAGSTPGKKAGKG